MLVMLGDDLGTTFVLLVIFLALLWVVGTPIRLYAGILGMIGLVLLILIVVAGYRSQRLSMFLHPQGNPTGADMQAIQGKWAVGSGSWFGVGLGASRQKWGWVPNDTTDFIFAILGEELGLVGTLCVSLLYGGLAFAGLRIAGRARDTFVRLAAAGATAWIVVQALVNIGAVLRAAAHHRRAAAAGVVRPVLADRDDGGARHADVVRQTRARGRGGACRCRPRRGAARPKLAWPGPPA